MEIEKVVGTPEVASNPVLELRISIANMIDDAAALAENGDWESLIRGLGPLQEVLGDLRMLESSVKQYIADTLPERQVTVAGVGTVERLKKTTRRNWDSEELLRKIVVGALVDPETGEIPSSPMEAVDNVMAEVKACVPFTGSTSWRVGALRDRGFDPDEWCEQNTDGYTIKFLRTNRDR
jgi:hypothetical protein